MTLDFPPALSQRVVNALKADPATVDLRAQAPHFYALGARILELFEEEEMVEVLLEVRFEFDLVAVFGKANERLGRADNVLRQTFRKRAADIADHARNPRGAMGEGADFLRGLDEMERQLFRSAHDSAKAVKTWAAQLKKS